MCTPAAVASALECVRRFARATNLVVASHRFAIAAASDDGDGDRSDGESDSSDLATALRRLLVALGARPAAPGEPIDVLWCVEQGSSDALRAAAAAQPGHDFVVVAPDGVSTSTGSDGLTARRDPIDDAIRRIRWAWQHMPVSRAIAHELARSGVVRGVRIGVALVLEPKTAVLSLLLRDAGAEVTVYAHADETDDAVAEALRAERIAVFASSRATLDEQRALAIDLLDGRPEIVLDDGSHVVRLAHQLDHPSLETMIGAAEETTSGLRPLRLLAERQQLRVPVIAVNDARTKTWFDNRHGTGQSCVFTALDLVEAAGLPSFEQGATAVVAGFGPVGEGTAGVLAAAGFRVVVSEVDPVRALQATYAGYRVAPLVDAVALPGVALVFSATGVRDTISLDVLRAAANASPADAIVAVAGGVEQEVALDAARAAGAIGTRVAPKVERLSFGERSVVVLDDGGCINVTAGQGNPIEIMDLSFAVQLEAVRMLVERGADLLPGVHPLDPAADAAVALRALDARGLATTVSAGVEGRAADRTEDQAEEPADGSGHREPADPRTTRFGPLDDGAADREHIPQSGPTA